MFFTHSGRNAENHDTSWLNPFQHMPDTFARHRRAFRICTCETATVSIKRKQKLAWPGMSGDYPHIASKAETSIH